MGYPQPSLPPIIAVALAAVASATDECVGKPFALSACTMLTNVPPGLTSSTQQEAHIGRASQATASTPVHRCARTRWQSLDLRKMCRQGQGGNKLPTNNLKGTLPSSISKMSKLSFRGQTGHSEVLASPKQSSAFGVEANIPRIWAFVAELFRAVCCFFSKSLCGAKNEESDSLIRKRPV
jgi:hypothetical protein